VEKEENIQIKTFLVQGIPGQNRGEGGEYPDKNISGAGNSRPKPLRRRRISR
jgi:hypothetical protein